MRHTVEIGRKAIKFLQALKDRKLLERLGGAIDALAEDPHPPGSTKLKGEDELYRVRVGDYRIIYQVQDAVLVVLIVEIGHRREIYR